MEIWRDLFGPRCSSNEVNILFCCQYIIKNLIIYLLIRSLEGLSNFASIESNTSVASLVLNFDVDEIGRTVSNTSINDFASNYQANDWGYNGPGVITRTLEKICNTNLVSKKKTFIHS